MTHTIKTIAYATGLALVLSAGSAQAAHITFPITYDGNDCSGVFGQGFANCKIPADVDPKQSPIIAKFDYNRGVLTSSELNTSLFPSINGSEFTINVALGTWSYNPSAGDPAISYYVAKGGNAFNLYSAVLGEDEQSGSFTLPLNNGGQVPGLSHISFYDTYDRDGDGDDDGDPAPEPATMALLGLGLLGAGIARRIRK